jgi:2-methylcitrate dehydratase PrpD
MLKTRVPSVPEVVSRRARGAILRSLTAQLIDLIRSKPVEHEDLIAASHFVLDTVACVIGGQTSPPGRILLEWFEDTAGDPGRAAFLTSGLAHILEIDDLHKDSVTHPGCVVIPPAWYLAQRLGASGREFLTAVLHGYEAVTRVGMAVGPAHYKLWHNTSTCGPFGAAMAVATLLELDHEQTVWALGNAGTQSCGLWQFLPDNAMSKHLHTARAAEAGFMAASLAARGFTGAERILEGEQGFFRALCPDPIPDALLAEPDELWQLRRTSMKPWPCCRHTHPAIDAALELHRAMGAQSPVSVQVQTYQTALDVCDRSSPETLYTAKFSLQHCVNVALSDGRVDFESFDDAQRARFATVSSDTTLSTAPEFDEAYPRRWGAAVSVTLPSGEVMSAARRDCKSDPELPLSPQEITEKAQMVMRQGDNKEGVPIEQILNLPQAHETPGFPLRVTGGVQ